MICARCAQPILRDEPSEKIEHHGGTGVGATMDVHARPCKAAPQQTYPRRRSS
ncbi:hypothetical protein [Streptomyces bauhiniae]|uniref:hypothetical protein n=1 Tax=Streptomyces bauhiniae TaxID=2340725 RepID=UPI0035D74853